MLCSNVFQKKKKDNKTSVCIMKRTDNYIHLLLITNSDSSFDIYVKL